MTLFGKAMSAVTHLLAWLCESSNTFTVESPRSESWRVPAPSLLAAKIQGALAAELNMYSLSAEGVYLTSDVCVNHPFLSPFEVQAVLPLDITQLKQYCRSHDIGILEIKQQGVGITPEQLRPQLKLQGEHTATLMLCHVGASKQAIFCQRVLET